MNLTDMKTTDLRKLAASENFKGQSSARKADLVALLTPHFEAKAEAERKEQERLAAAAALVAEAPASETVTARRRKGQCTEETFECKRPISKWAAGPELCDECLEYASWENTHSDMGHAVDPNAEETESCPVCHPELDPRTKVRRTNHTGSSKAGMVIYAKGSAEQKAKAVIEVAEERGMAYRTEVQEGQLQLHAGDDRINVTLRWDGAGRFDYTASTAVVNGKTRKVRNVSEARRFLTEPYA